MAHGFLCHQRLPVRQVTKVDMENGTVDLRFSEMIVNNLNLRFVDRKTGESKEEGATRPDVILRQLSTRPGQVGSGSGWPFRASSFCARSRWRGPLAARLLTMSARVVASVRHRGRRQHRHFLQLLYVECGTKLSIPTANTVAMQLLAAPLRTGNS